MIACKLSVLSVKWRKPAKECARSKAKGWRKGARACNDYCRIFIHTSQGKVKYYCQLLLLSLFSFPPSCLHLLYKDAAWPSGQCIRLTIWQSRVRVPLWPLAGFVLSCPEFKSSATLVKSQLVASCQLGFFNPVMLYFFELFDSKYLSGVPVN